MVLQRDEEREFEVFTCELCHAAIDDQDDYIEVGTFESPVRLPRAPEALKSST